MFHGRGRVNLKFDAIHFLLTDKKDLILLIVGLVIAGVVASFKPMGGVIVLAITLVTVLMSVYGTAKGAFSGNGDLLPTMVVDSKNNLIAILADLDKSEGGDLAIKIMKAPLGSLPGGPFKDGTKMAFVAMYNGFAHESSWRNFGGWLLNVGTKSLKANQKAVESFDDDAWGMLKDGIRQIKKPYKVKLYQNLDL